MRGRLPSGPEFVAKLPGHEQAKQRLQIVLETLAGTLRVHEACARLNLSEQRFEQLRIEALQGAIAALEPKPLGRRPAPAELEELAQLQAQVADLQAQLELAAVQTEVAAIVPPTILPAEKKSLLRRPKVRRQWKR
jgi:hypothetical protein